MPKRDIPSKWLQPTNTEVIRQRFELEQWTFGRLGANNVMAYEQPKSTSMMVNMIDWNTFLNFLLQRMTKRTAEHRFRYAKKHSYHILQTGDASTLLQMSPDKRIDIMKALVSLSRFQGCYDRWLDIKQKYNLKWSTGTESLDSLERVFDESKTLDTMIGWVRRTHQELPTRYRDIFLFCALTGLRPTECLESIRLIKNPEGLKSVYYNTGRQVLEHFRFPEIFIRRSKSAYISLVTPEFLEIVKNGITENSRAMYSYNAMRYRLKYSGVGMHMKWCRKVFASWLHHKGIQSEIIDLLQGRVPKSIFVRSYLTPSLDYRDKILTALNELKREVEC